MSNGRSLDPMVDPDRFLDPTGLESLDYNEIANGLLEVNRPLIYGNRREMVVDYPNPSIICQKYCNPEIIGSIIEVPVDS